jgi:hypothetical protein
MTRKQSLVISWQIAKVADDTRRMASIEAIMIRELKTGAATVKKLKGDK